MKFLNKLFKSNYWDHYYYNLEDVILDKNILQTALNNFWDDIIFKKVKSDNQLIYIIFKVRLDDNSYASISYLQKINQTQKEELLNTFIISLDTRSENYTDKIYRDIIFTYHILNENDSKNKKAQLIHKNEIKVKKYNFGGINFPVNTDYTKWGITTLQKDNFIVVMKENSILPLRYEITIKGNEAEIQVISSNKTLYKFNDTFGDNSNSFTRIFGLHEYVFIDSILVVKKLKRRVKFFNRINTDKKINTNFIALDIETRTIDNIFIPYCISYFDGVKATSFYLSDYKNSDDMLTNCIISLLKRKYNGYKVYVHNLSNFDGIFLLRLLSSIPNFSLDPIIRDGKLINLTLSRLISGRKYSISFRDSLLMLPVSLDKLSKAFKVENKKTIFPYRFVNNVNVPLTYEGAVPSIELFDNLLIEDYKNYINNIKLWNLRNETIKYCENDCISLYQVLESFNTLIYNKYKLNINKFTTLPSLTLAIYRSTNLRNNIIPKITGDIFEFIRSGYTGGHTDVYKPTVPEGVDVYCYDVNSLYPYVMKINDMPIGTPQYFEYPNFIDISEFIKNFNKPFGFFEVEVTTPNKMERPLFQTKVKINSGIRTISPLGTWIDVIFSEEMFKYMQYGYKFKVKKGYLFQRSNIFKEYITDLYKIKQSLNKDEPMYLVSKLLMNSLYGRFGMSNEMSNHVIINNNELTETIEQISTQNGKIDILDLNNGKTLLTVFFKDDNQNSLTNKDISIGISAAITAYSRMFMSDLLYNTKLDILYMDTDSIFVTSRLPDNIISKDIGKWKLEYVLKKAIFLAPKVYGGITNDGKEISKVKGYKNSLNFDSLITLLRKDSSIKLYQEKWFKSLSLGYIKTKPNSLYTLIATENKRELIYKDNILTNSRPYKIDINKNIINNS